MEVCQGLCGTINGLRLIANIERLETHHELLDAPGGLRGSADKALQRDVQLFVQPADHCERQATLPC